MKIAIVAEAYEDILSLYNTKVMAKQYSDKYEKAINKVGGVQRKVTLYVLNNYYATAKAVA